MSDFIRCKALEAAEIEFLERRVVTIPAADWDTFEAWAHCPARKIPALKTLLRGQSGSQPRQPPKPDDLVFPPPPHHGRA